jgi:hypothetical protein
VVSCDGGDVEQDVGQKDQDFELRKFRDPSSVQNKREDVLGDTRISHNMINVKIEKSTRY